MKCPSSVTFKFDPKTAKNDLFRDPISLIIWGCIASNHLRNQYFNDEIKQFVETIKHSKPETYQEFKICICTSSLKQYGRDCIDEGNFIRRPSYEISDEFWMQVWRYVKKYLLGSSIQIDMFPENEEFEVHYNIGKMFFDIRY